MKSICLFVERYRFSAKVWLIRNQVNYEMAYLSKCDMAQEYFFERLMVFLMATLTLKTIVVMMEKARSEPNYVRVIERKKRKKISACNQLPIVVTLSLSYFTLL